MLPRPGLADEDEVDEVVEAFEPGKEPTIGPRPIQCPECPFAGAGGDVIGAHIERHRPNSSPIYTRKGKLLSSVCPKGCGRFFNRTKDVMLYGVRGGQPNDVREFSFHVQLCDGSKRLPTTTEEEEMARTKKTRKPQAPKKQSTISIADGCPLCPQETFKTPQERGAHFRHKHPDWKSDPKLNPTLRPSTEGQSSSMAAEIPAPRPRTPEVPDAPRPVPFRTDGDDLDPLDKAKQAITQIRDTVAKFRENATGYEKRADELEAKADALEKALED